VKGAGTKGRGLVLVSGLLVASCGLAVTGSEGPPADGGVAASLPEAGTADGPTTLVDGSPDVIADVATDVPADTTTCTDPGLLFDGVRQFVAVAHDDELNVGNAFAVEAWIRPGTNINTVETHIVSKHDHPGSSGWVLLIKNQRIEFRIYGREMGGSNPDKMVAAGADGAAYVQPAVWAHVAGTYDGTNLAVYYAGALKHKVTVSDFMRRNTTNAMTIGKAAYTSDQFHYDGEIDEVRISEVDRYAMAATITKPALPFVADGDTLALYHFNEASGGDVLNAKSPGLAGVLGAADSAPLRVALPCIADR
jgi:hypothetical protein